MREAFNRNRRIVILQALEQDGHHELSAELLQRALRHMGHQTVSMTAVDGLLDWLTERDFVATRDVDGVRVVSLTDLGLDVALGNRRATGVDRPARL